MPLFDGKDKSRYATFTRRTLSLISSTTQSSDPISAASRAISSGSPNNGRPVKCRPPIERPGKINWAYSRGVASG